MKRLILAVAAVMGLAAAADAQTTRTVQFQRTVTRGGGAVRQQAPVIVKQQPVIVKQQAPVLVQPQKVIVQPVQPVLLQQQSYGYAAPAAAIVQPVQAYYAAPALQSYAPQAVAAPVTPYGGCGSGTQLQLVPRVPMAAPVQP